MKLRINHSVLGRIVVLLAIALGTVFPALHTVIHGDHGIVHSCEADHSNGISQAVEHQECSFCLYDVVLVPAIEPASVQFVPPYCAPQNSAFPDIAEIRRAHGLMSSRGPPALI